MYGGSRRRHNPHNASPLSEVWHSAANANGLIRRSPQIEQSPPAIGRIAPRHSSQTGSREMFIRGALQRRQSEGNNVAKRAAAMPLAQETDGLSCATTLVPVARIGVPLLLKTILPRPAVATRALLDESFSV